MLREYGIDLLDFYRGLLSPRRLVVLLRHLSRKSSLSAALNGGEEPWSPTAQRVADLWVLWTGKDHPIRAEITAAAQTTAKQARVSELRAKYESRNRKYGSGDSA